MSEFGAVFMLCEWEGIYDSFVLVTIINIVWCPIVVVCDMLWPKLFLKITTLTNLKSLEKFFFEKSYCVVFAPYIF
jgi:hypothetical protein